MRQSALPKRSVKEKLINKMIMMKQKEVANMRWLLALLIVAVVVGCTPQLPASQRGFYGSAVSTVSTSSQQTVPSWAKTNNLAWASRPQGILLQGSFDSQGKLVEGASDFGVLVSGFDIVWPEGYVSNVPYILAELAIDSSGSTINPAQAWRKFNFKDAQGNVRTAPNWIDASQGTVFFTGVSSLNTPSFIATQTQLQRSAEELNVVLIFACNQGSLRASGAREYNCNGADGKKVVIGTDGRLESDSGRGSWMLTTVGVATATTGGTGTPPDPTGPGGSPEGTGSGSSGGSPSPPSGTPP